MTLEAGNASQTSNVRQKKIPVYWHYTLCLKKNKTL